MAVAVKNHKILDITEIDTTNEVYAKRITVTPALAKMWLDNALPNRTSQLAKIRDYAHDMRTGQWLMTGQGLLFDANAQLMDGKHRLLACIEADTPFETMATFGLAHNAMALIDTDRTRTPGDALAIAKQEPNARLLAAALKWVWLLEQNNIALYSRTGSLFGRHYMLDTLERHPEIRDSLRFGSKKKTFIPESFVVAAHYLMSRKDSLLATEYISTLLNGENLTRDDSVYMLRERLQRESKNPRTRLEPQYKAALVIKVWNDWRRGRRKRGTIRWVNTGDKPEAFPEIL